MKFTVDAKTEIITEGGTTATRAAEAKGKPGVPLSEMVKVGQAVEVEIPRDGSDAARDPSARRLDGRRRRRKHIRAARHREESDRDRHC